MEFAGFVEVVGVELGYASVVFFLFKFCAGAAAGLGLGCGGVVESDRARG